MLQKFGYIFFHYVVLFIFLFSSWGSGRWVLSRSAKKIQINGWLEHALESTLGIGFFICALQWLAIAGELRALWINVLLTIGVVLGIMQLRGLGLPDLHRIHSKWKSLTLHEKCGFLVISLFILSTLLDPIKLPLGWDEVMYHLPHARQWALSGRLDVNEWLRYPWFPYNYELLYAAALIVYDDVMPHMLHAAAGWLVALIIYQVGKRYSNHGAACLGAIIWLLISRGGFDKADVDMGITLFVFAACVSFYFWLEEPQQRIWLAMAAFLMGVAVGSKYQTLSFLPLFSLALLIRERKPATLLMVLACLIIPSIYWYARNGIMTGDPFNPIGGKLFGFTDWNLGDYKYQFEDLKRNIGWPHWAFWPALLTPFIKKFRDMHSMRVAMIFCAYSLIIWIITSHYPRYLMPVYPLLALLAGCGWQWIFSNGFSSIAPLRKVKLHIHLHPRIQRTGWATILTMLSITLIIVSARNWNGIGSTDATREAILYKKISGYPVLSYIRKNSIREIYQFGLEDAIYYAPNPIWGDHFGPGRYRDFSSLKPAELAFKLKKSGFRNILIHTTRWSQIDSQIDFNLYFLKIYQYGDVKLYRIIENIP